jgi:hypothetical protein
MSFLVWKRKKPTMVGLGSRIECGDRRLLRGECEQFVVGKTLTRDRLPARVLHESTFVDANGEIDLFADYDSKVSFASVADQPLSVIVGTGSQTMTELLGKLRSFIKHLPK